MRMPDRSRRRFLECAAGLSTAALAGNVIARTASASATGMPTRILGRTGVRVSIIGVGGWHAGAIRDERESIRLMQTAVDEGINFFDNCWDYLDGRAEEVMGKALEGRRQRVFLMTKVCDRDYAGAMKHLEDSLRRLKTDHLDLWQFHEICYDNDPDWVFEKGAIKAALEAQRAGKIRFIGFTGHKDPRIHLKMLAKPHSWDACQMPINVMDYHFRSFQNEVVPVCLKHNVGVIGMKGLGGGYPEPRFPARAGLTVEEGYGYCFNTPVATQVVGMTSLQQLKQNVALARAFRPMRPEQKQALLHRVKDLAGDGRHELFKTTRNFDGPYHRRQHGFEVGD